MLFGVARPENGPTISRTPCERSTIRPSNAALTGNNIAVNDIKSNHYQTLITETMFGKQVVEQARRENLVLVSKHLNYMILLSSDIFVRASCKK